MGTRVSVDGHAPSLNPHGSFYSFPILEKESLLSTLPKRYSMLLLIFALPFLSAQTFQVTDRSPAAGDAHLNLDATITVSYNVSASGLSGSVVPVLVPRNQALVGKVVATWTGVSPTSNLSNLTFKVHLYDDGTLCAQTVAFDLIFYSTSFEGGITATSSNTQLLDMEVRGTETTVTDYLSYTPGALPFPLSSASGSSFFLIHRDLPQLLADPNYHIYFWADYNLVGASLAQQFNIFAYPLGGQCSLDGTSNLNYSMLVSGTVINQSGIFNSPVVLAPPGGGGSSNTLGSGVNIYDITYLDLTDPDCPDIRSIHYGSGAYALFWQYGGFGAIVRAFGLFLGLPNCKVFQANFGTPPGSNFRIDNFYLSSAGEVSADLAAPAAWLSGGQLGTDFRVQWFLRKDGKLVSLGSESRSLALDAIASEQITDPQKYWLEARVRRVSTGGVVNVTNPGAHNRAYTLNGISFQKAEEGGSDEYLDPGETMTISWKIDQVNGAALPTLQYASGVVIDANGNGVLEPAVDTYLVNNTQVPGGLNLRTVNVSATGSGSTRTALASFELLTLNQSVAAWFYMDVTGSNGSTTTTYRRYFSLRQQFGGVRDLDAEDTNLAYDYDFQVTSHLNDGWQALNDSSNGSSRGWSYDSQTPGPWIGTGGQSTLNAQDLYRLQSPALPLGRGTAVDFNHLTQFTPNVSGGLVEYRTRQAGNAWPSAWNNLITSFCSGCGYYDGTFSSVAESYLSGRQVWMNNDSSSQFISVNIPDSVASGFPENEGEIQLRFLFANTNPPSATTHWELDDFSFVTQQLLNDNVFGIDRSGYPLFGCDDPTLSLLTWAPYPLAQLTFVWYDSLNALWNGQGTSPITGSIGAIVPFVTGVTGLHTYYVRISRNGVERVMEVTVNESIGISQGQAILQIVTSASSQWPSSQSILPYVTIVNSVCPD